MGGIILTVFDTGVIVLISSSDHQISGEMPSKHMSRQEAETLYGKMVPLMKTNQSIDLCHLHRYVDSC